MAKMSARQWAERERTRLGRFLEHWESRVIAGDPSYPEELEPGDWDEQFHFFDPDNENIA
jgi:hypothetical protein